jgi:adenosylhomocysteine nucleosidase
MKIAIFSAFPQESRHIRRRSTAVRKFDRPFPIFLSKYLSCDIISVETGMDTGNVKAAFKYTVAAYRPDVILSIGFGGALYDRAAIGDLILSSRHFLYTRNGLKELPPVSSHLFSYQRSITSGNVMIKFRRKIGIREGSFITLPEWTAKSKLKATIPDGIPFPVCDRETFHLAQLSQQNNIPFLAVRAITDLANEEIPEDLFHVTDGHGNYRLSKALGLLFTRPSLIPDSLKLGRNAALASKSLWEAVKALTEVLST